MACAMNAAVAAVTLGNATVEELMKALEAERGRADALQQELAKLRSSSSSSSPKGLEDENGVSLLTNSPDDGAKWPRKFKDPVDWVKYFQNVSTPEFRVLRQNVFSGRWTLYISGDGPASKPLQYKSKERYFPRAEDQAVHEDRCPFCKGNENRTPDPLLVVDMEGGLHRGPDFPEDWSVRVVPNIFPILCFPPKAYGEAFERKLEELDHSSAAMGCDETECRGISLDDPLYPQMAATGFCEVVIEGSRHNGLLGIVDKKQVFHSLRAMYERGKTLSQEPSTKQLLYFKQYGPFSGGSLVHPHMQIMALPVITPQTENHMLRCSGYFEKTGRCLKCDVCRDEPLGAGPASQRLIHRSKHFLVVVPFSARSYHISIVPLKHSHSWLTLGIEELEDLAFVLQMVMEALYHVLDDPSYILNIFSLDSREWKQAPSNIKESFHWSLEVQPRTPDDFGGMEVASAIRVVEGMPEDFAALLRGYVQESLRKRHDRAESRVAA